MEPERYKLHVGSGLKKVINFDPSCPIPPIDQHRSQGLSPQ